MLFWFIKNFQHNFSFLSVIDSIICRAIFAVLTAFLIGLIISPIIIRILISMNMKQIVRFNGPKTHLIKSGVPTMGGILILICVGISVLLWADLNNHFIWIVSLVTLSFGIIGFIDDYRKILHNNSTGMSSSEKYFWQSLISLFTACYLIFPLSRINHIHLLDVIPTWIATLSYLNFNFSSHINLVVPFYKVLSYPLGMWGFILFTYLVIIGTSNAVNLTDGLDGLAIMPIVLVSFGLGVFSYLTSNLYCAHNSFMSYVSGTSELIIFCGALIGAGLAFLWYNIYPAQIFMGDVGALALGASLGTIAVIIRQEIVLFIMGGVFVLETFSVILQVIYFKFTKKYYGIGKRLFLMAPLHHHYEQKGLKETQVIVRFWITTMVFVLFGLLTLRLN